MDSCAVLVLSCDKYADLWKPFFQSFWKFWPSCPYPVYLGSNTIAYEGDRVATLLSGEDTDWSSSYRSILAQIEEEYLYVFLEDIFLIQEPDPERIRFVSEMMIQNKGNHLHFAPIPKPERIENGVGIYERGMPYRATVVGLWNRQYLLQLILDGESAWNFEILGSYRTQYDDGFYCASPALFHWLNVVEKGVWQKRELDYCIKNGYTVDLDRRAVLSGWDHLCSRLKKLWFDCFICIPWRYRVKLMNGLRKLFISY